MATQDHSDNPDRPLVEANEHTTPPRGVKLYYLRTLVWTYLVWATLNVFFASQFCHVFNGPLTWIPYYWALFHIILLYGLIMTLWEGNMNWFMPVVPGMVAGLFLIVGLFIKER